MLYPTLSDLNITEGNDGSMLYNPSRIAKGYDYGLRDSVAIEIPRNSKLISVHKSLPVYRKQNPSEFKRLSRRADEAKSVAKNQKK